MTTLTIKIDDTSVAGKNFLNSLKTLNFVAVVEKKVKKKGLDKALDDVKKGRVYTAKNTKDLIKKITE